MPKTTTLTSREFHQDSARVKRAAKLGPVVITERGKPTLVVLDYHEYEKGKSKPMMLGDIPGMDEDIDLEIPPRSVLNNIKPFEFED